MKNGISLGEVKVCSRGVPNGSVLGPLLFTLYTRHLPALLTSQCVMFADDNLLFFSIRPQPTELCAGTVISSVGLLVSDFFQLSEWILGFTLGGNARKDVFTPQDLSQF